MPIRSSEKEFAFNRLTSRMKLHIKLSEAQTDYQKIVVAIRHNEPSLVKFYLDTGVSANLETGNDSSPLLISVMCMNPLITKMLLSYGANPGFKHRVTHTTLVRSVFVDYDQHMSYGSDVHILNSLSMIAALLRNAGQRFDLPDSSNRSPLDEFGLFVGRARKTQVLAEFLEQIDRADINSILVTDVIAQSPEEITRLSPQEEHKVFLFQHGRYVELLSDPLRRVEGSRRRFGFTEIFHNELNGMGALNEVRDEELIVQSVRDRVLSLTAPFFRTSRRSDPEQDRIFSHLRERSSDAAHLLLEAVAKNDLAAVTDLLAQGVYVDVSDMHGSTSLMIAVKNGCIELVKVLLDAGADPEVPGPWGDTTLITACRYGRTDIVKELLARGANKDVKNLAQSTALMTAIQYHHDQIIYILKNFGTFQYRLHDIEFDENKLGEEDKDIYASLCDPISLEIMNDPIAVSSGITYDRQSLSDWFESKKSTVTQNIPATVACPITKLPIQRGELNNKTHIITKGVIHNFVLRQEALFANPFQATASDKVASSETIEKKQNTGDIWQQIARLKDRGYATHAQIRAIFPDAGDLDFSTILDMFPEIKIFEHDPTEDDLVLLAITNGRSQ